MSRETIYTCDRCKKKGPEEVHSFDFGKDYSSGRNLVGEFARITIDLCRACWEDLKGFLHAQKS